MRCGETGCARPIPSCSRSWLPTPSPVRRHERPRGDFSIAADAAPGDATVVAIAIDRSPTSFERIRLSVTGLPDGATATLDPSWRAIDTFEVGEKMTIKFISEELEEDLKTS